MIELLQFLFATEKDQNLYHNRDALVKELLNEHRFTFNEVKDMLEWFAPIVDGKVCHEINPHAIREITLWEKQRLPLSVIEQIMQWEQDQLINSGEREVLLDRLAFLELGMLVDSEDIKAILDGLIFHLQNYKSQLIKHDGITSTYCQPNNYSVH